MPDLRQIALGLGQLERCPHETFVPNEGQRVMTDLVQQPNRIKLILAGNGIGKTMWDVELMANIIWPGRNRYFDRPFFMNWRWPKAIRIISTPKNISDNGSIQTWIDRIFPKGGMIEEQRGKQGYRWFIRTDTGWTIQILSNRLDRSEYAGPEFGLIIFDEPFPSSIFGENLARTRAGGTVVISMTPVTEPGAEASELLWIQERLIEGDDYDCVHVKLCSEMNCKEHGRPGFLAHANLEEAIQGCAPQERAARWNGEICLSGGLVHPSWAANRDAIRIKPYDPAVWKKDERSMPTFFHILDPHDRKPFVMLWFAQFYDGHGEFVAEYPNRFAYHLADRCAHSLADYVEIVEEIEKDFPADVRWRIIDKWYGNQAVRYQKIQSSIKMELHRLSKGRLAFMDSPGGENSYREACRIIADNLVPGPLTNLPRWRAWDTLFNLDFAMCRHSFKPVAGRTADQDGDADSGPTGRFKCFPNCVEYLALTNPRWEPVRRRTVDIWQRPRGEFERVSGYA